MARPGIACDEVRVMSSFHPGIRRWVRAAISSMCCGMHGSQDRFVRCHSSRVDGLRIEAHKNSMRRGVDRGRTTRLLLPATCRARTRRQFWRAIQCLVPTGCGSPSGSRSSSVHLCSKRSVLHRPWHRGGYRNRWPPMRRSSRATARTMCAFFEPTKRERFNGASEPAKHRKHCGRSASRCTVLHNRRAALHQLLRQ